MVLIVGALLCWLWGMFFWFSAQQKAQLLEDRTRELVLMASAVKQHSSGLLHGVASDMRELDTWLLTHPGADPLRDSRFLAIVDDMRKASKGLTDIRMVSEAGMVYYLPSLDGLPRADVADREYFKFHAAGEGSEARTVHVNAPVQSRVDQRWYVPVSMRLSPVSPGDPMFRSAAVPMVVMYAAVALERLAGEHENMRFKPDGAISLVRSDGILLSRAPITTPFIGRDLSGSQHFGQDYGQSDRGSFVSEGAMTDGIKRLVSFERLRDYPVTVLVSRSIDDVFAIYYTRMRTALALNGMLTLIVVAVTTVFVRERRAQIAMRLQQDDLRRLATTDELTGVMNRRAFMDSASREFERARRYKRPTAILAIDIDHFKRVNDDYGHASGDIVLRSCAERWQGALRDQDFLGRVGGEEFCVVLPETSQTHAQLIAERLRSLTVATPVLDGDCVVSVSIGWTTIVDGDTHVSAVLERADRFLYISKADGRNRVSPSAPCDSKPLGSTDSLRTEFAPITEAAGPILPALTPV